MNSKSKGNQVANGVALVDWLLVGRIKNSLDLSPVSIQTQSLAFLAVFVYATHATPSHDRTVSDPQ